MAIKQIFFQECQECNQTLASSEFYTTKNICYPGGTVPVCRTCLKKKLPTQYDDQSAVWEIMDQICMFLDIPFVPDKFVTLWADKGRDAVDTYIAMFQQPKYSQIRWKEYQEYYESLQADDAMETITPGFQEKRLAEMKQKWGYNYDEEELNYLEKLYEGVLQTQNINGALQTDQALKLCKISLQIESRIREGADFDKLLGSYEKLVKVGDFTPKNVKNANDFDSVGEIFAYLEKTGFKNKFYDGVTRDIVDNTMKNIQKFCQRLYTNESGMGDEITQRLEALRNVQKLDDADEYEVGTDFNEWAIEDDEDAEEFEADV